MIINKLIHRQHLMALLEGGTIFYKHGLVKVTGDITLRVYLVFFLYFGSFLPGRMEHSSLPYSIHHDALLMSGTY